MNVWIVMMDGEVDFASTKWHEAFDRLSFLQKHYDGHKIEIVRAEV